MAHYCDRGLLKGYKSPESPNNFGGAHFSEYHTLKLFCGQECPRGEFICGQNIFFITGLYFLFSTFESKQTNFGPVHGKP